jgi:uncharacterized protein (DUF885 family)
MTTDLDFPGSPLAPLICRYSVDLASLQRFYPIPFSPTRRTRLGQFYAQWLGALPAYDFVALPPDGQIDYLLFRNELRYQLQQLDIQSRQYDEIVPLIPFAATIVNLAESRQRMQFIEPRLAAQTLNDIVQQLPRLRESATSAGLSKAVIGRAVRVLTTLRETLTTWFNFYNGYDPAFTWWTAEPYKSADAALTAYLAFLRENLLGVRPDDNAAIFGDPLGESALLTDLAREFIPYSPAELLEIGHREFDWCKQQMQIEAKDMGLSSDWRAALERVKNDHVTPGEQPRMVRDLALEAIDFVRGNDLMTLDPLAVETWRMDMMTPEKQKVNPFFLGGETIVVSYPTSTMSHDQKLMAMRGNNIHFARATVHHELIPGHHIQEFMTARHRPYRQLFNTPFWIEGWTLHWEMLLWEMNFPCTPENRIGMLFWRAHRCARIIFSLGFHLNQMSPRQCIDMLVNEVGHEKDNAEAEVRRSLSSEYPPLYQAAYMLGGLQMHALHRECTAAGRMTHRQFHDEVLKHNSIPLELLRARLLSLPLRPDYTANWRFHDLNRQANNQPTKVVFV